MGKSKNKADDYSQLSPRSHVIERVEVYGTTKDIQEYTRHAPSKDFSGINIHTMEYSMLLKKLIDEIGTNAIDQSRRYPKTVSKIWHSLEKKTGAITIINNGTPVPLVMKKNIHGVEMPLPQFLFCELNTSSNYNKDRKDRTQGGCNGVGAPLVNIWSTSFTVEVYDKDEKKLFQQTCEDNLSVINEPFMDKPTKFKGTRLMDSKQSYTAIRFIPDYKRMGYTEYDIDLHKVCSKLLRTQALVASIASQPKPSNKLKSNISVYYNDELVPIKSIKEVAIMNTTPIIDVININDNDDDDTGSQQTKTTIPLVDFMIGDEETPWHVALSVDPTKGMNQTHISTINGVYTTQGGTHIDHIIDQLIEYIKPRFETNYTKKYGMKWIRSYINFIQIYVVAIIKDPSFDGQKKDALATPKKVFKDTHIIPDTVLTKISKLFMEPINDLVMLKTVKDDAKNSSDRSSKEFIAHYTPARKQGLSATLCLCEGTSAQGNLEKVVKKMPSGTEFMGTLALQGVIPNALKESKLIINPQTKEIVRVRSPKLQNNTHIRALYNATKLNPSCKYEDGDDKEFDKLNYGSILIVTDQDVDGFNIQSLIVTLLATFHPGLFDRGFIRILNTPVINAMIGTGKSRQIKTFHTEKEYDEWIRSKAPKHDVKYIKGLATASDKDLIQALTYINRNTLGIRTLYKVDLTELNIYYGPIPDLRKKALSAPQPEVHIDLHSSETTSTTGGKKGKLKDIKQPIQIGCKELMHGRAHEYQLDNLDRKIPNIMDGLNQAKRKTIATVLTLPKGKKTIKTSSLAGMLINKMAYHHGDASAGTVILKMTHAFYGGQNIPQLITNGFSGSRSNNIMGAARYVDVAPNSQLLDVMYNPYDNQLLKWLDFDGDKIEPTFFIPAIPTALLNTYACISSGWSTRSYARDYNQVIDNINNLIKNKPITKMDHDRSNFRGKVVHHNGYEWCVGTYNYHKSKNMLQITELPLFIWTDIYIYGEAKKAEKLHNEKMTPKTKSKDVKSKDKPKREPASKIGVKTPLVYKKYVKKVENHTIDDHNIDIHVYLEPGAYKTIMEDYKDSAFDGIEKYFGLNVSLKPNLNFLTDLNTVTTYDNYECILEEWFIRRKQYYIIRYEREIIIINLKIKHMENLIRFTDPKNKDESNSIVNTKNSTKKAISLLESHKYQKFNTDRMNSMTDNTPNDELNNVILNTGANYSYILNLTCTQRLKEAHAKRLEQLSKLKDRLQWLLSKNKYFPGAQLWIQDLKELKTVIDEGVRTKWKVDADIDIEYV